jgi:hypothetical protein
MRADADTNAKCADAYVIRGEGFKLNSPRIQRDYERAQRCGSATRLWRGGAAPHPNLLTNTKNVRRSRHKRVPAAFFFFPLLGSSAHLNPKSAKCNALQPQRRLTPALAVGEVSLPAGLSLGSAGAHS